ncbi:hypothetical protein PL026_23450 [Pseudomonas extremaustralis]|nr:hypothetical protein [Pseudomonas extremaustralis]
MNQAFNVPERSNIHIETTDETLLQERHAIREAYKNNCFESGTY